eukprot:1111930-Karenia_brevis.AAC.1
MDKCDDTCTSQTGKTSVCDNTSNVPPGFAQCGNCEKQILADNMFVIWGAKPICYECYVCMHEKLTLYRRQPIRDGCTSR